MSDEKAPTIVAKPKSNRSSRNNRRKVVSETPTEVVMEIAQKAYKGEKINQTIRKDHKFDPKQRLFAGRAL